MARQSVPAELRKQIREARKSIEYVAKLDGNEAETRRRVERIFETLMGFDIKHLSREHAVKGAGATEHVDFAIQLEEGQDAKPIIMVELKRVGVDLAPKHLRQVSSYAINAGCEWVLLTNGREWRIYHVEFAQPPITKLVDSWNLLKDDLSILASKFNVVGFKSLRRGSLKNLWTKTQVLAPESILSAVLSIDSLRAARRVLRKKTDVLVDLEDIVNSFKRLLNEAAARTLDEMGLEIPGRRKPSPKPTDQVEQAEAEGLGGTQTAGRDAGEPAG